ncbi:L-lactate dehydrogenase [Candidatus Saccharibacteria bacterium]|nr:L-lactate dehydrogenase [Candidatus Saccharibacteria bacterium]
MSNKIMIVGTGNVGASIAYAHLNQRTPVNEMILTDINAADAEGEAMDLIDALTVAPSFLKIRAGEYKDAKDCDIVIITAGAPQKPGETRMDLLKKNAAILKPMVGEIMKSGFSGIFLIVSNPMDVLTYLTYKYSGLPSERVIGSGTVLDSARLRHRVASYLDVNPKSVNAWQVGEHGDTEFALWSLANVGGEPAGDLLDAKAMGDIEDFARNEAYEIIKRKGATYYGVGCCVTHIVNTILNDERRVLPISSYDDFQDIYNGFPTVVGRRGAVRRLDLKLSEIEAVKFQKSCNAIKKAIREVEA